MAPRREPVDDDPVRQYLSEIARHPLLNKQLEVELAQCIEAGRAAAEELAVDLDLGAARRRALRRAVTDGDAATLRFVQSNLRLVVAIAKRHQSTGLPLLDLIQEGNLGLMHAVEKFDWRKGFKFSTYATWWIRQAISRGTANTGRTIRLPVHASDLANRVHRTRFELANRLGRRPTTAEIADALDVPVGRIDEILQFGAVTRSLSEPLASDAETELSDLVADPGAESPFDAAAAAVLPAQMAKLLGLLDDRERSILELRFGLDRGEPRTLEEVGNLFDVSRERIRQIEARALSKLRHPTARARAGVEDLVSW